MKDIDVILHSEYIIDGQRMEATPAQMLSECMPADNPPLPEKNGYPPIVDEPSDPAPGYVRYSPDKIKGYLSALGDAPHMKRDIPVEYSGPLTRLAIARTLLETLWKEGHFSLENIEARIRWEWDCTPVGNMAALYFSAEAAGKYLYDLGIRLSGYSITESSEGNRIYMDRLEVRKDSLFTAAVAEDPEPVIEDGCRDAAEDYPEYTGSEQDISMKRKCPETLVADNRSWIIYIPFDTCPFKLGGSMLAERFGSNGDNAPEIQDPDYFIDCYEVLRELVEDGVVISGITVSGGGLASAAGFLCRRTGCTIDVKGLENAYREKDIVRILFAEVPGVLIQIRDSDYDYVDAQLLLQEIAYYPLGHPDTGKCGIEISEGGRPDVFSILEALLNSPTASEGED
ncbi:MAG: hypothetical protein IAB99_00980 [Bacteroidetes bacterium]|uniref:Phosphoribosylformylglycinamidine synthase n=1 Tax=Candidatus Cryptobacteroides faecipullorum TaxID=2840764 RepID=A0A9D9NAB8_9BACT|nr:hypothetical protein [Candidatus Cryptobacteroides faecipullorum]